jgi:hypothetical protein
MTKLCGIAEKRKNMIHAAGSYLFRASSAGDWAFHNHLCPELIGDVIVTGKSTGKVAKPLVGLWYRMSHFFSGRIRPLCTGSIPTN